MNQKPAAASVRTTAPDEHGSSVPGTHLAALASLELMGPARLKALLRAASARAVWDRLVSGESPVEMQRPTLFDGTLSPDEQLGSVGPPEAAASLDPRLIRRWIAHARNSPDLPAVMGERLAELGVSVFAGDRIPQRLSEDPDPPAVLFSTGSELAPLSARVAVVGTRKASQYGLRVAHQLGRDLAARGVEVVSGLALGIDAAAHAGALQTLADLEGVSGVEVTPGVTAVIGAGHDRPCPVRNRSLSSSVARRGTVLGEVPPGVASAPWRFPVRNRLIAALADVVVVVESALSGGSMSTVSEALRRDRPVMAVPGPLGRATSEGCHQLLRDGAQICTGIDDVVGILEILGAVVMETPREPARSERPAEGAEGAERAKVTGRADRKGGADGDLLDLLASESCDVGTLAGRAGLDLMEVSAALVRLESASLIVRRGGWIERI